MIACIGKAGQQGDRLIVGAGEVQGNLCPALMGSTLRTYQAERPGWRRVNTNASSHKAEIGARHHISQEAVLSPTWNGAVGLPVATTVQNGLGSMLTAMGPIDG